MPGENAVCAMTSGDIARLLDVDLKTIHNWVRSGHLHGRRTEGRHLRFLRTEVVRFMRRFGYRVPETIARSVPRLVLLGLSREEAEALTTALTCQVIAERPEGLFQGALVVAAGDFEVLVIHLGRYSPVLVSELLRAVRERPTTQGLAVVGVSEKAELREVFLQAGGDVALEGTHELAATVHWLVGAPSLGRARTRTVKSQGWRERGRALGVDVRRHRFVAAG